jgi:hypothetical protein
VLFGSDFINGFTEVAHDMKAIQDMDGLSSPGPNDIEIWTPHIRANVIESLCSLLGKPAEERLECLFAPFGARIVVASFNWDCENGSLVQSFCFP